MKKIKLFFIAFFGVCLGLTSFSSAFSAGDIPQSAIITTGSVNLDYTLTSTNSMYVHSLTDIDAKSLPTSYYCAYVYNFDSGSLGGGAWLTFGFGNSLTFSWPTVNKSYTSSFGNSNYIVEPLRLWLDIDGIYENGALMCNYNYRKYFNIGIAETSVANRTYKFDYIVFDYNKLAFASSVDCSQDSNYLQCLEDKNQLIGQVSTLSGSLTSCQSDLSACRGGQDASLLACIDQKEQCETSLNTLSGNYASLENMNSSLSSQLQECLESSSNSTGELICNKFDLFWSSDNTNYSFPINNDLILPPGYKGFVNEGVLAIKSDNSLDSAYSIDDADFQKVMNGFGVVFLYLFGSALFLIFVYVIRGYFIGFDR